MIATPTTVASISITITSAGSAVLGHPAFSTCRPQGGFFFGGNMTEFTQTLRQYCRNPRCRSKLPSPASDPRKAFCTRGCHSSFYLKRCVVCEAPFTKTRANQEVCRKVRCRRAFREAKERFRYYPTSAAFEASKSPDFIGSKPPPASDRPWRIVAGPELSRLALHCAIVGATEPQENQ